MIKFKSFSFESTIYKLSLLVAIVSGATLITVLLFPLFSDEIQIRMWLSRLPYDFPNRVTGVARCFTAFSQSIPYIFYPAAAINWLTHGLIESPTFLRVAGTSFLAAWLLPFVIYLWSKDKPRNLLLIFAFVIGLLFIGINPIFISISRSEQFYYPSLILLIYLAINKTEHDSKYLILKFFSIFLLITLILYGHPKGLFFLPFFFLILWIHSSQFKHPKVIFISAALALTFISLESLKSWSGAFICKEIPEYEMFLKSFSFDPLSIFYNPTEFFNKVWISLSRFNEYPSHFEFKKEYIWGFLPGIKNFNTFHTIFNFLLHTFLILIYFSTLISLTIFIIKKSRSRSTNFLLLTLLICTTLWAIFNLTKNIYDASFFYTITCIVAIIFIFENSFFYFHNKLFRIGIFIVLTLSLFSQGIFVSNNLTPFINGFTGPGIRIGSYEFNKTHQAIQDASKICGIDRINGKFIVIDDLTYGYFRKSHGPISYSYNGVGATKTPLQDLFRTVESDGMILYCPGFPAKFRQNAVHVDNICCISKSEIKRIFVDKDNSELD